MAYQRTHLSWYRRVTLSAVAVAALMSAAPAFGTVTLSFVAQNTTIPSVGGFANVEIRADFTEPILGWGLDLNVDDPGVADLDSFTIGPAWDPVLSSLDGDLLGGTAFPGPVGPGSNILLATLTFEAFGIGVTPISLSISGDEDEGFAIDPSGLDSVVFAEGTIRVPEPAALTLLALGAVAVLRRR